VHTATSDTVLTGFETFVFTDGTVDNADGNRLVDDLYVKAAHVNPLEHFLLHGIDEQRCAQADGVWG
jgi:hypothetical protein